MALHVWLIIFEDAGLVRIFNAEKMNGKLKSAILNSSGDLVRASKQYSRNHGEMLRDLDLAEIKNYEHKEIIIDTTWYFD